MLALLVGFQIIVTVDGESTCPTPARVSERLAPLLADVRREAVGGRVERAAPDHARVEERGDVVELELESGSGRELGRRVFPRRTSCDELASAIAVVIATWEAGLSAASPEISIAAPAVLPVPSLRQFAFGATAVTTRDRARWTIGAAAELSISWRATRWSGRVAALATTRHRDPLGPGEIAWARQAAMAGVRYQVAASGAFRIGVTGDAVFAVLMASGAGFSTDRQSYSFDPGVAAGVRTTWTRAAWDLVLEANECLWLRDGHLEVTGLASEIDLPRHELHLNLGFVWRFAEM